MAFDFGYPNLGNALLPMISALPVLIPLVLLLMRRIPHDQGPAMSIALTAIEAEYRPRVCADAGGGPELAAYSSALRC